MRARIEVICWPKIDSGFLTLSVCYIESRSSFLVKVSSHIRVRSALTGRFASPAWSLDVPAGEIRRNYRGDGMVNLVMVAMIESGLKQWSWTGMNWIAGRRDRWPCHRLIVVILLLRSSIPCLSSICTSLLRQDDGKGNNSCMARPSCAIVTVRESCYSSWPHIEIALKEVDRI